MEKWRGITTQGIEASSCAMNGFKEWKWKKKWVTIWAGDLGTASIPKVNEGYFRQV